MKLILIEDEEMLRRSLAFFLRAQNYDVQEFDNGADAIDHIQQAHETIDMIITDLNLPFAGGKQVLYACKSYQHIKKIVLTSLSVEANEVEVFELGADDFIAKPFSPQALLKRIAKLSPQS